MYAGMQYRYYLCDLCAKTFTVLWLLSTLKGTTHTKRKVCELYSEKAPEPMRLRNIYLFLENKQYFTRGCKLKEYRSIV